MRWQVPPRVAIVFLTATVALHFTSPPTIAQGFGVGANFIATDSAHGNPVPDTMGAVGPDQIAILVNGRYRLYDKLGNIQAPGGGVPGDVSLNEFWAGAPNLKEGTYDPHILYDPTSQRWFATSLDNLGVRQANNFLFAVSKSSDLADGWNKFSLASATPTSPPTPATVKNWADFDTIGFNNDVVLVGARLVPIEGGGGVDTTSYIVIPKANLLGVTPTFANAKLLENQKDNAPYVTQPVIDFDAGTVGSSTNGLLMLSYSGNNDTKSIFNRSRVNGPLNTPAITLVGTSTTTKYDAPPDAVQPDMAPALEAQGNELGTSVVKVGGVIWGVQGVNSGGRSAVRWFKMNPSTGEMTDGLLNPTASNRSFIEPSIAANPDGTVVIGMTGSSAADGDFASNYFAVGRTDVSGGKNVFTGTTTFSTPSRITAGTAAYDNKFSDRNRWGDYSATSNDPADPNIFWTFQQLATGKTSWDIRATEIIAYGAGEFYWKEAVDGNYNTGARWLPGTSPGANDAVFFARPTQAANPYVVTFPGGTVNAYRSSVMQGDVAWDLNGGTYNLNGITFNVPGLTVAPFQGTGKLTIENGYVKTAQFSSMAQSPSSDATLVLDHATWKNDSLLVGGSLGVTAGKAQIFVEAQALLDSRTIEIYGNSTLDIGSGSVTTQFWGFHGGSLLLSGNQQFTSNAFVSLASGADDPASRDMNVRIDQPTASIAMSNTINSGPSGTIHKYGPGKFIYSGDSSNGFYQGGVDIQEGVFQMDGVMGPLVNRTFTVGNGIDHAVLQGNGHILGQVNFGFEGHVAAGDSVGTLFVDALFGLPGGFLDYELASGFGDSDYIDCSGNVGFNGDELMVTALAGFGPGTYHLIGYDGTLDGMGLTLANKPNPALTYQIVFDQANKFVDLVVTPEPASAAWLVCLLAMLKRRPCRSAIAHENPPASS